MSKTSSGSSADCGIMMAALLFATVTRGLMYIPDPPLTQRTIELQTKFRVKPASRLPRPIGETGPIGVSVSGCVCRQQFWALGVR
jgi:hypothetical protein